MQLNQYFGKISYSSQNKKGFDENVSTIAIIFFKKIKWQK